MKIAFNLLKRGSIGFMTLLFWIVIKEL